MRTGIQTLWLLLALASVAAADEKAFQFVKKIAGPELEGEELLAAPLDSDVFATAQPDLSDVRVIDADGNEIAFVLRVPSGKKAVSVRRTFAARAPSIRLLEDGGMEITVALDEKDPQPHGITVVTPLKNFEQRVQVHSSPDGENWMAAGEATAIFDYSRYMDVRNVSIPLPNVTHRHFRLVIDDVTAEQESELLELTRRLQGGDEAGRTERFTVDRRPFRIDRLEFWREEQRKQETGFQTTAYPVSVLEVSEDVENKQTVILLGSRREPLTSLSIQTEDRNFSRKAAVQIERTRGVQRQWVTIGEATVTRIDFKQLQDEQLSISFPETRAVQYRLVIENRDSPPLKITGVRAEGNVHEVVFLAAPGRKYRLVYGSPAAEAPRFDTAALNASLANYEPQAAELGEEARQDVVIPPKPFDWSRLLNEPRFLFPVIGLLVVLVGWGLFHASRRLDSLADTGSGEGPSPPEAPGGESK